MCSNCQEKSDIRIHFCRFTAKNQLEGVFTPPPPIGNRVKEDKKSRSPVKTVSKTHFSVKSYGQNKLWTKMMAIFFVFWAIFGRKRGFQGKHFPCEFRADLYVFGIRRACRMGKDSMLKMSHKKRVLTKCRCLIPWSYHTKWGYFNTVTK